METTADDKDILIEELDVEAYAQANPSEQRKPEARFYIIRIDQERKRVRESQLTGTEILALVDKTPETHKLFQKLRGGKTDPIEPRERVSFVAPGVERFQTIPNDTTEGGMGY